MRTLLLVAMVIWSALAGAGYSQDSGWKHSGSLFVITSPEGANLPGSAKLENFPLLVRLHKDSFDFSQAQSHGEDIRFFTSDGKSLPYQVEEWDAELGIASIWVRIPVILGNARQELKLKWGNASAASESKGPNVFNESNGYASVWHLGESVVDDAGATDSKDEGTTPTLGIIGKARHLAGKKGIFGGDKITGYPSGVGPMTTEVWFRAEKPNGTVLAWGEEKRPAKVMVNFLSPPRIAIQCYFADVEAKSSLATNQWYHVVHTYSDKDSRVYINGVLDGHSTPVLDLPKTSRLWIGGWYGNYNFIGDVDEVRISKVVRSPEWIQLQYENQKPLQTLVGPVVRPGNAFSVSSISASVPEGKQAVFSAKADGAQKIYWTLRRDGQETIVATDRLAYEFHAGRVTKDESAILEFKAIYPSEVKTQEIAIQVKEDIQEPLFTLKAPTTWDGRSIIEIVPEVTNLDAMKAKGAGDLKVEWNVANIAVIKEAVADKLLLKRSQNSGRMTVTATLSNGGKPVHASVNIAVTEPQNDPWLARVPDKEEKPEEGQFYARDENNEGTLYYNGSLAVDPGRSVFLNVYADDKLIKTEIATLAKDKSYSLSAKLKPGLIKYKVEFGEVVAGRHAVLETVGNIVCGDAYIIQGQSNALATDTGEKSPPETSEWIRSYGQHPGNTNEPRVNRWCYPVWKAREGEKAELGWWGMELAKQLVESQKMPILIINGAVGGTRIDQHQRNDANPTDGSTIYGRMLWRIQQARLTHGIRGVLWHQGESDQGSDGPDGGYGWETYEKYFVEMAADWKQDFPNIQHYYLFQIWPNACSMGNGHGDMLREVQRNLPRLYSNMDIMPTLGIKPPGGCHFPLVGWAEFARLIRPLMERDNYGRKPTESITAPNLIRAYFKGEAKDAITLEFDQPVNWDESLVGQFILDGAKDQVASGSVSGNLLTLKLKEASPATSINYLSEKSWSQEKLIVGENGIAALTFCEVPLVEK